MKSYFFAGGISLRIILFVLFSFSAAFAQVRSNLEVYYVLCDSSVQEVISRAGGTGEGFGLELNAGTSYTLFNSYLASKFEAGKLASFGSESPDKLILVVEDASVKYEDMFRDGFLGSYRVSRFVELKGNYLLPGNELQRFAFAYRDTVNVDDIRIIENESIPFTQGEVPAEPFFSGLFEPIAAIGTAAAAIILFFTIRSK